MRTGSASTVSSINAMRVPSGQNARAAQDPAIGGTDRHDTDAVFTQHRGAGRAVVETSRCAPLRRGLTQQRVVVLQHEQLAVTLDNHAITGVRFDFGAVLQDRPDCQRAQTKQSDLFDIA